MVASVMIHRWTEVPRVCAPASSRPSCIGGLVDDSFASWGHEGETIPIIWASNGFISQNVGVDVGRSHQVESVLDLGCEFVP
jgi:hypothetical protein